MKVSVGVMFDIHDVKTFLKSLPFKQKSLGGEGGVSTGGVRFFLDEIQVPANKGGERVINCHEGVEKFPILDKPGA